MLPNITFIFLYALSGYFVYYNYALIVILLCTVYRYIRKEMYIFLKGEDKEKLNCTDKVNNFQHCLLSLEWHKFCVSVVERKA